MSNDKYLEKLAELRNEIDDAKKPLLDFLENFRPTDKMEDGKMDSQDIKVILGGMAELEINFIAQIMVRLGYRTIYHDYEYTWNIKFIANNSDEVCEN